MTEDGGIECPYCGVVFKTLSGVRKHIRFTHDMHTCPVCGRWFRKLSSHVCTRSDEAHRRVCAVLKGL
jgi:uncharacterized C2H2 Zn-finger protein